MVSKIHGFPDSISLFFPLVLWFLYCNIRFLPYCLIVEWMCQQTLFVLTS
jgi:hypothetical protein